MDTSKEYAEMCWEAKEIQELLPEAKNQYFISCLEDTKGEVVYDGRFDNNYVTGHYSDDVRFSTQFKDAFIWLPRQDQLQEMIKEDYRAILNKGYVSYKGMVKHLSEFAEHSIAFNSMEQLWLVFVMKEKYGKTWTKDKTWK